MDREELLAEICAAFNKLASHAYSKDAANRLMKRVDEYVESEVVKARLNVMKNFGAI